MHMQGVEGFEFLKAGGYGHVFYNPTTHVICKKINRYVEHEDASNVHAAAVQELVLTATLKGRKGCVRLKSHAWSQDALHLFFPHHGMDLYAFRSKHKPDLGVVTRLMVTLIDICVEMAAAGLQHTDIKPGNVLMDQAGHAKLIDYNCMSVALAPGRWCSSVGTYAFVAPEIVHCGAPTDTSVVWSLGVLAATLLQKYPFCSENLLSQSHAQWVERLTLLEAQSRDANVPHARIPVERSPPAHVTGHGAWALIQEMLVWDPSKRMSMAAARKAWAAFAPEIPPAAAPTPLVGARARPRAAWAACGGPRERRRLMLLLDRLLWSVQHLDWMGWVGWLLDRAVEALRSGPQSAEPLPLEHIAVGCWWIVACLCNVSIELAPRWIRLMTYTFHCTRQEGETAMLAVGAALQWQCYAMHPRLHANGMSENDWLWAYVHLEHEESYDLRDLAKIACADEPPDPPASTAVPADARNVPTFRRPCAPRIATCLSV